MTMWPVGTLGETVQIENSRVLVLIFFRLKNFILNFLGYTFSYHTYKVPFWLKVEPLLLGRDLSERIREEHTGNGSEDVSCRRTTLTWRSVWLRVGPLPIHLEGYGRRWGDKGHPKEVRCESTGDESKRQRCLVGGVGSFTTAFVSLLSCPDRWREGLKNLPCLPSTERKILSLGSVSEPSVGCRSNVV